MRRAWPWWLRAALAVLAVVLVWRVYAGWHWHTHVSAGPGVFALSPTGKAVVKGSAYYLLAERLVAPGRLRNQATWRLGYALATSLPAAALAVVAFTALTRWFGPKPEPDPYTRCRRCGYILFGLTEPRCPECGERI